MPETQRPTWYLLWCRYCHPDSTPMPFASPEERDRWASTS
jgi:sorbitol-specific phosphotransferase system component IIC